MTNPLREDGKLWTERALRALSLWAIPFILVMFSAWAIVSWPLAFTERGGRDVQFREISDGTAERAASEALHALATRPLVTSLETKLAETPFWILVDSPTGTQGVIEFPSRHAQSITCFRTNPSLALIGEADRVSVRGALHPSKAGFSLDATSFGGQGLLCRSLYKGPAHVTVAAWPSDALEVSAATWNRNAGLLEGGILTLAIFVFVVALINRHIPYFVFALWLIANLRVAEISAGWDFTWLGHQISPLWLHPVRQISIATLWMLTVVLTGELFEEGLKRVRHASLFNALRLTTIPLFAAAVFLGFEQFLPVMWVICTFGIIGLSYVLIDLVIKTRSRVALWFSASLGTMLLATLYEIVAAALGYRGLLGAVNSVTASLASTLLAALAIAEHLRKARNDQVKTYQVSPIGLATIAPDGQVLRMNQAFASLAGCSANDPDVNWSDYFPPDALTTIRDELRGESGPVELAFSCAGTKRADDWYELTAIGVEDGNIEAALHDITERKVALDRLHWLADHDPLTGLLNRRGLSTALSEAATLLSQGRNASLAYVDLNRFKLANDLYGHATGDRLLEQVTARLQEQMQPRETLARVGGDEFVVVFVDLPLARAKRRCDEMLDAIATPLYALGGQGRTIRLSASIGLVEMADGMSQDDAIAAADQACRSAKRDGSHGLMVYPHESSAYGERLAELQLIKRFGTVGDFGRMLSLQYQPLLRLNEPFGTLNLEALLRANDPHGQPIPAMRLIEAAEKAGVMQSVDLWVLESTLKFLDQHRNELQQCGLACVNLSGLSLNDEAFVANAAAVLRNYPQAAERLCFEITEAVALHDLTNTRRWIERQRSQGAKVALDDFGAGYSSFAYLRELPADALKIDGAFVRSMAGHAANQSIVKVMIDLAHNLGMSTVAECVEDLHTVRMLHELGADYVQGFVIARPMDAAALLRARSSGDLVEDPRARKLITDLGFTPQVVRMQ